MKQSIFTMQMVLCCFSIVWISSCATHSKSGPHDPQKKDDSKKDGASAPQNQDDELTVSGNLTSSSASLSNNGLTSKFVDRRTVADAAAKLEAAIKASKGDDRKALVALMSLRRLSGEGLTTVMDAARELVAIEMQKNVSNGLPEYAKLELVLSAIQAKKYSFAEYFLDDLVKSKNPKIVAGAYTALGIIAATDERLPEAITAWNKALEVQSDYEPALLNIGFYAAKYGDFALAKKSLGGLQADWFAAYGLITAERMTKENARASSFCGKVLETQPRHKPALFNCALHEAQGNNANDKAIALLEKMTKISGHADYDEKAFKLRDSMARNVGGPNKTKADGDK